MEKWFSEILLKWYGIHKRDLPWRHVKDPYKIWLSEVILQQTQVVQGHDYYLKFLKRFPGVRQLASANEDEVLKLWQGLGYYSRARNLLKAAQQIMREHKGKFPESYLQIRALPGIGEYTAAAISSFSFNQAYAVLDGNVYRVLSRIFGIDLPIDTPDGKRLFRDLAARLLDQKRPAEYNQAIMEFGSQHCRPKQALCQGCPFSSRCSAFLSNNVYTLPKKAGRPKIRHRYLNYIVLLDHTGQVAIRRRDKKDIWQGLYEFILLETDKACNLSDILSASIPGVKTLHLAKHLHTSSLYKHQLTHQLLEARFYVFRIKKLNPKTTQIVQINKIGKFAFPRLLDKFLQDCELKEFI
ncbi:MAG TPA: A/G-specific adenine glycosylase [Bacteroidia bacterium]|nr:A/G-specific adenine glycosylase [Bacteroidia bacterium]